MDGRAFRLLGLCFAATVCTATPSAAEQAEPGTQKEAFLEALDGTRIKVADIVFKATDDGAGQSYEIRWNKEPFSDHFLSMRPFRCIAGPDKHWCHVPYPYEIERQVRPDELTDLEYDFLFVWKGATDYGIDLWNGVYYDIETDGERLVGRLHDVNMDVLAVPPEQGDLRPIAAKDLEPGEPESHWLPTLIIE